MHVQYPIKYYSIIPIQCIYICIYMYIYMYMYIYIYTLYSHLFPSISPTISLSIYPRPIPPSPSHSTSSTWECGPHLVNGLYPESYMAYPHLLYIRDYRGHIWIINHLRFVGCTSKFFLTLSIAKYWFARSSGLSVPIIPVISPLHHCYDPFCWFVGV